MDVEEFEARYGEREAAAARDLDGPEHHRQADLRYASQSFELAVDADAPGGRTRGATATG